MFDTIPLNSVSGASWLSVYLHHHLCTVSPLNSSPYIMWVIQYGANCVKQMCPIFIF